jgi:hypothetical protein
VAPSTPPLATKQVGSNQFLSNECTADWVLTGAEVPRRLKVSSRVLLI